MSTKRITWCVWVAVFVLPLVGYVLVNGYWWLFDGNVLRSDKMGAAGLIGFLTSMVAAIWADFARVWK